MIRINNCVCSQNQNMIELICFLFPFFLSLIISFWLFPPIIRLSRRLQLFDAPTKRKSHRHVVPFLGGVCIFLTILGVVLILGIILYPINPSFFNFKLAFGLFIALFILIILGLKDDLMGAKPIEKLIFQILAVSFLILVSDVHILSLNGLFGIYYLSPWTSFLLSLFVFVLLINAFNLIDGIDGLSASISIISNLFMGAFFINNDSLFNAIIMFSFAGATLSFLFFNFSPNRKEKVFLGDNGALCLGLISAYGIIISMNQSVQMEAINADKFLKNFQIMIMALMSYPLLDTLRVFVVRLFQGINPFGADNNHMHHHLLKLRLSHKTSTLIIVFYTMLLLLIAFVLRPLNMNDHFMIMLMISMLVYFIPVISRFYGKYKS